jgi:hypothetical protein
MITEDRLICSPLDPTGSEHPRSSSLELVRIHPIMSTPRYRDIATYRKSGAAVWDVKKLLWHREWFELRFGSRVLSSH